MQHLDLQKKAMTDSLILGLSSGSACLATCGMVMFPFLMADSAGTKKIAVDLSFFLLTRFIVYAILATLSWYFGQAIFSNKVVRNIVPGILYIVFAILLVWYSIRKIGNPGCHSKIIKKVNDRRLVPVLLGLVNSLGFCPALFIILTKGATEGTLLQKLPGISGFFHRIVRLVFAIAVCRENS